MGHGCALCEGLHEERVLKYFSISSLVLNFFQVPFTGSLLMFKVVADSPTEAGYEFHSCSHISGKSIPSRTLSSQLLAFTDSDSVSEIIICRNTDL